MHPHLYNNSLLGRWCCFTNMQKIINLMLKLVIYWRGMFLREGISFREKECLPKRHKRVHN